VKRIFLISFLPFFMGCVTTAPKVTSHTALDETLKLKEKKSNVSVKGVLESELKGASCSVGVSKLKIKWNWKDAVAVADSCLKNHDFNNVEFVSKELSLRNTFTPWGPYFYGQVALERGELDRALWMSELSLKRAPEYAVLHYLNGQIHWARKDYSQAVASFEKSVAYDDSLGSAHLILGQVYIQDQDFKKASAHFALALKASPNSIQALVGQAESEYKLNHYLVSVAAFSRLAQLDKTDGRYLSMLGRIYEGPLNDQEKALESYLLLQDRIKTGKVTKNADPENDSKVKELLASVQKQRHIASVPQGKNVGDSK
jgi:tetratricopeptide (TPR) repeat protein